MIVFTLVCAFFLGSRVDAEVTKKAEEKNNVYLVDMKNKKAIRVERDKDGELKLLPNRLYQRFEPLINKWVFEFVGVNGKLSTPSSYLLPLSDLPGEWVGGNPKSAYIFLGPPAKGWKVFKEIPKGEASQKFRVRNLTDPPDEKVYFHSVDEDDL
jgi:hypothetical protein